MVVRFYNTLTRGLDTFKPFVEGKVGLYTCGPTMWNYPHLGNYRSYIFGDLLKRYLKYKGFEVHHVMNITDVDDKTIKHSQDEGKSLKEFTELYTQGFMEDLKRLNIESADEYPKATDHIPEMIALIQKLLERNIAYKADDGCVYYGVNRFKNYGYLARIDVEDLQEGASGRVLKDEYDKEHAHDFALWKAYTPEDGAVSWESPFGKGRPGWHIECSAMSMKYLGDSFDIHTGGIDLIFPHHQNEIAQSEGATGKPFVRYWLHNEWLLVDGKKMSKSAGNFYTLRDVLEKSYDPIAVRYHLLATHYRQQLNFTLEGLQGSVNALQRLRDFKDSVEIVVKEGIGDESSSMQKLLASSMLEFEKQMDNDLEISGALGVVFNLVRDVNSLIAKKQLSQPDAKRVLEYLEKIDSVLGLLPERHVEIPEEVNNLVEEREQARKDKDWKRADEIRDKISELGFILEDTPHGPRCKLA